MKDNETTMGEMESDINELKEKLVRLSERLAEVEGLKRSANKGFNDDIKDVKAEIKMTLDLIKEQEGR
jgi:hypothetical protein